LTKIKKLCILIAGGVEDETKKKGGESMMEKRERNTQERLIHRWVGELLAVLTTSETETTIDNYITQLPPTDQKWIWISYAIKLAQLGQKEKALEKALRLNLGIEEVTDERKALEIAVSGSGVVARVGEKLYAYTNQGKDHDFAIRKLMHELRK